MQNVSSLNFCFYSKFLLTFCFPSVGIYFKMHLELEDGQKPNFPVQKCSEYILCTFCKQNVQQNVQHQKNNFLSFFVSLRFCETLLSPRFSHFVNKVSMLPKEDCGEATIFYKVKYSYEIEEN